MLSINEAIHLSDNHVIFDADMNSVKLNINEVTYTMDHERVARLIENCSKHKMPLRKRHKAIDEATKKDTELTLSTEQRHHHKNDPHIAPVRPEFVVYFILFVYRSKGFFFSSSVFYAIVSFVNASSLFFSFCIL